ncbi:MAG TPA: argininosuccinate lyase [Fimbriimonadaceae bacterium]|nr:argininosuccinate lyase [Fimbriimonadaceae bacterium]HRJ96631.1 argininosuccinate lyase [Fimbriimonadaceae bacterium]
MRKLWGGAFDGDSDDLVDRFGQSIQTDLRFWHQDVAGSIAHARMLGETGILAKSDARRLVEGLEQILTEGPSKLPQDVEDIHTAVELRLGEVIGDVAGKLHTARSRNDQVATDTRLYLRARLGEIGGRLKKLQQVLLESARRHRRAVMPGYTHQQPAQPITLGLHQMAHFWAFQRHGRRIEWITEWFNFCPLGSAALAGTWFPIDRHATARELGFSGPVPNALDATSDRSFVLDALHVSALVMLDLSRIAQELILWSGAESGFVRLADNVTTGSSIMPQKRNPDMAELIRGRTGRAIGNWTGFAATMKALPLGYNRDTQDDKPGLFESLDLVADSLRLTSIMLETAEWNLPRMRKAAAAGFSTATDLADLLASRGMPFREAHEIVGRLAKSAAGGTPRREAVLEAVGPDLVDEAMARLDPVRSAMARSSFGGPGDLGRQLRRAAILLRRPGFGSAV